MTRVGICLGRETMGGSSRCGERNLEPEDLLRAVASGGAWDGGRSVV